MTCIVGIVSKGVVYMGGDSLGTTPDTLDRSVYKHKKVFHNGPLLIGSCGSAIMSSILAYRLKPPVKPKLMDDMKFMNTKFVDAVWKAVQDAGYDSKDVESSDDTRSIIGFNGALYEMSGILQIDQWISPYVAIGLGSKYAYGSLFMTEREEPRQRILSALAAAAHFNASVAPPFYVLEQAPSHFAKHGA